MTNKARIDVLLVVAGDNPKTCIDLKSLFSEDDLCGDISDDGGK